MTSGLGPALVSAVGLSRAGIGPVTGLGQAPCLVRGDLRGRPVGTQIVYETSGVGRRFSNLSTCLPGLLGIRQAGDMDR